MGSISTLRPSPALIVAMAALVMAMSGAAIALPGKGSVKKNDIAKGAVRTKAIAPGAVKTKTINKGAVGSQQIKGKSIKGNRLKDGGVGSKQLKDAGITNEKIEAQAVTADKVKDGTLTGVQVAPEGLSSGNISDYAVLGSGTGAFHRLTATDGGSEAAARDAAPATQLFKKGQLTISAKCFRDTVADQTFAEVYVETAANGAIFTSFEDALVGGNAATDFLNTNTALVDSTLAAISATGADADMDEGGFSAHAVDGTTLKGQLTFAAKNGALAGGNGAYGEGNVCLFGGEIAG